jgi:methionyl-tRNA formyltransferase
VRLVFLGTPEFAVPTLERIVEAGHEVLTVVTQPDRPKGRGQQTVAPPVKQAALRLGLPIYQPERVRRADAVEHLRALAPEIMVVVGYGQIIPQSIIDIAPRGIVNVHASLLPKYRGAAPVQWAIVTGESVTGVTTMQIDAGLDTGDILLSAQTEIGPEENALALLGRLAVMGADTLVETLEHLAAGDLVPVKQDSAQATYAPILKREDGWIDWSQPAQAIHNRVRGLQPWPGAYTQFRGQTLHIWKSKLWDQDFRPAAGHLSGSIVSVKPLIVNCGSGALELLELQLAGRKRIFATDFANGQRLKQNERLGASSK